MADSAVRSNIDAKTERPGNRLFPACGTACFPRPKAVPDHQTRVTFTVVHTGNISRSTRQGTIHTDSPISLFVCRHQINIEAGILLLRSGGAAVPPDLIIQTRVTAPTAWVMIRKHALGWSTSNRPTHFGPVSPPPRAPVACRRRAWCVPGVRLVCAWCVPARLLSR